MPSLFISQFLVFSSKFDPAHPKGVSKSLLFSLRGCSRSTWSRVCPGSVCLLPCSRPVVLLSCPPPPREPSPPQTRDPWLSPLCTGLSQGPSGPAFLFLEGRAELTPGFPPSPGAICSGASALTGGFRISLHPDKPVRAAPTAAPPRERWVNSQQWFPAVRLCTGAGERGLLALRRNGSYEQSFGLLSRYQGCLVERAARFLPPVTGV